MGPSDAIAAGGAGRRGKPGLAVTQVLVPHVVPKPWGRQQLPAFLNVVQTEPVGEIHFDSTDSIPEILLKYIFTSAKLSIQVHPDDAMARAEGLPSGKDECWLIIDADPDAEIGLGTKECLSDDELRSAAVGGSLESLLDWKPVKRGDFFYVPAGTLHAIGAGISLIEFQQNSDVTYRLYDYGRARDLHVEQGVAAACAQPYCSSFASCVDMETTAKLVDGPKFDLWHCVSWPPETLANDRTLLLALSGSTTVNDHIMSVGECVTTAHDSRITIEPGSSVLVAQVR